MSDQTNDNNQNSDVDLKSQLQDFDNFHVEKSGVMSWLIAFVALSIAIIIHSGWSVIKMLNDDSIPLVVCPRTFDLDRPVLMETITEKNEAYVQDRWIRGFIRTYVMSLFPRTPEDAEKFFSYIRDHSTGSVQYKYKSYVDDIKQIEDRIRAGNVVKFYPKTGDGVRIRPTQKSGVQTEWAVEVDGYLNKGFENNAERTLPKVRMIVKTTVPTQTNPEGLIVTDLKIDDTIADFMSSREKDNSAKEENKE